MKLVRTGERTRRERSSNLLREAQTPAEDVFDLEQEATQEDWDSVWAVVDKNTLERPGFLGGGAFAWDHMNVVTTWIGLADVRQIQRLRSDERVRALAEDRLRGVSYDPKSEALGKQLYPDLLRSQATSDPELLAIYTPHLVDHVRLDTQGAGPLDPRSEAFVKFLQLRPRELKGIQQIFESHPALWPVLEKEFEFYVSNNFWRLAVQAAADLILLKPETQTTLREQLRPYLPKIKAELKEAKQRRAKINSDDWTQGELYTLEACKLMSGLAVVFGSEPHVNGDGFIQVNKKKALASGPELPIRSIA